MPLIRTQCLSFSISRMEPIIGKFSPGWEE